MKATRPSKPNAGFLEELFPPRRIPASQIGGVGPEVGAYVDDFGGRAWTEVDDWPYQLHTDAYCLMDPKTLVHYIAGFMRLALSNDSPGHVFPADEYLVYFAASDSFVDFCRMLTVRQIEFVIQVVDFFIHHEFFSDAERVPYGANRAELVQDLHDKS